MPIFVPGTTIWGQASGLFAIDQQLSPGETPNQDRHHRFLWQDVPRRHPDPPQQAAEQNGEAPVFLLNPDDFLLDEDWLMPGRKVPFHLSWQPRRPGNGSLWFDLAEFSCGKRVREAGAYAKVGSVRRRMRRLEGKRRKREEERQKRAAEGRQADSAGETSSSDEEVLPSESDTSDERLTGRPGAGGGPGGDSSVSSVSSEEGGF